MLQGSSTGHLIFSFPIRSYSLFFGYFHFKFRTSLQRDCLREVSFSQSIQFDTSFHQIEYILLPFPKSYNKLCFGISSHCNPSEVTSSHISKKRTAPTALQIHSGLSHEYNYSCFCLRSIQTIIIIYAHAQVPLVSKVDQTIFYFTSERLFLETFCIDFGDSDKLAGIWL